jgi:hypothetical protein
VVAAVVHFNLPIPHEHVVQMVDVLCDKNGDGKLNYCEFAEALTA